jgi:hypothetical protein
MGVLTDSKRVGVSRALGALSADEHDSGYALVCNSEHRSLLTLHLLQRTWRKAERSSAGRLKGCPH